MKILSWWSRRWRVRTPIPGGRGIHHLAIWSLFHADITLDYEHWVDIYSTCLYAIVLCSWRSHQSKLTKTKNKQLSPRRYWRFWHDRGWMMNLNCTLWAARLSKQTSKLAFISNQQWQLWCIVFVFCKFWLVALLSQAAQRVQDSSFSLDQ